MKKFLLGILIVIVLYILSIFIFPNFANELGAKIGLTGFNNQVVHAKDWFNNLFSGDSEIDKKLKEKINNAKKIKEDKDFGKNSEGSSKKHKNTLQNELKSNKSHGDSNGKNDDIYEIGKTINEYKKKIDKTKDSIEEYQDKGEKVIKNVKDTEEKINKTINDSKEVIESSKKVKKSIDDTLNSK